jgi:hypothetical protein
MNILKTSATVLTACALGTSVVLGLPQAARADYQNFRLAPGFLPDPAVGTGLSGGSRSTGDCGYVDGANAPDHVMTLTRPFSFLRASVAAEGDVTLLITGPDGRYCSDDANGLMPEVSGFWPAGTYQIWVGDFVGDRSGSFRYQLFLSEE